MREPSMGRWRLAVFQGNPIGSEFRVNTYTTGHGVFGQRHDQIVPVEMTGFTVE
jgi:hypothetical protein